MLYVVVLDLYYPDKITGLLSVIYVPHFILYYFAIGSSIVVSVQYFVLLAQLFSIYDIILRSRFSFRREEELSRAKEKLEAAAIKLRDYGSPFLERWKNELERKRIIIDKWELKLKYYGEINQKIKTRIAVDKKKNNLTDQDIYQIERDLAKVGRNLPRIKRVIEYLNKSMTELESQVQSKSHIDASLQQDYLRARSVYDSINKDNPSLRKIYVISEVVVDISRTIPPAVVSIFAIIAFFLD